MDETTKERMRLIEVLRDPNPLLRKLDHAAVVKHLRAWGQDGRSTDIYVDDVPVDAWSLATRIAQALGWDRPDALANRFSGEDDVAAGTALIQWLQERDRDGI